MILDSLFNLKVAHKMVHICKMQYDVYIRGKVFRCDSIGDGAYDGASIIYRITIRSFGASPRIRRLSTSRFTGNASQRMQRRRWTSLAFFKRGVSPSRSIGFRIIQRRDTGGRTQTGIQNTMMP